VLQVLSAIVVVQADKDILRKCWCLRYFSLLVDALAAVFIFIG
jgi:hypothetical protein